MKTFYKLTWIRGDFFLILDYVDNDDSVSTFKVVHVYGTELWKKGETQLFLDSDLRKYKEKNMFTELTAEEAMLEIL